MTLASNYSPIKQSGVGVTNFSYDFDLAVEGSLVVSKTDADGVTTILTLTTDYTVNTDTKIVTLVVALATDEYIVIYRDTNLDQSTEFKTSSGFQAKVVENSFDKAMAINQENADANTRSIKIPIGLSSTVSTSLPTPEGGKALKWNATATAITNSTVDIEDLDTALTQAETYATAAATSASSASTYAGNADTSADEASASALAAATSETNAEIAATAVTTLYELYQNITSLTSGSGAIVLSATSSAYKITPTAETTITFDETGVSTSHNKLFEVIIDLSTLYTINFPTVTWNGGVAPTLDVTGLYIFYFRKLAGGSVWYGSFGGKY